MLASKISISSSAVARVTFLISLESGQYVRLFAQEVAVHDVLGAELAERGAPLLRGHLTKVGVPAARKGQRWVGAWEADVGSTQAYRMPKISLNFLTLYCFGRHGSFTLPWNMASLSFLFFSPLK